ncbi:hypothetical protein DYU11_15730 [Fibrisoma montanum]|uniref:Tail specific protease domain-containing protein n=1 Tax=Fibrisoma montanum TaxID=2305895 RepID=A0A418M8P1_9BACT|nr:S41 family peptidase [Fibrisoma montanum]RIV22465.1 hypothetical protein DYU11_15730 [Fibrisoma montanum]
MKRPILYLALGLLLRITNSSIAQSDPLSLTKTFPAAQYQEEVSLLRKALEESHPGLYRYTPKHALDSLFDHTTAQLATDKPLGVYYRLLATLLATVRCAHTQLAPPPKWDQTIRVLPYNILFINGKTYITVNATSHQDTLLIPGSEVISINGKPIEGIREQIKRHLFVDGYSQAGREAALSKNFGGYYYLLVEQPDSFVVEMRRYRTGELVRQNVAAVTASDWLKNAQTNPVNKVLWDRWRALQKKESVRLEWTDTQTAVLTIRGFGDNKKDPKLYQQFFRELQNKKAKNLIINLRDNTGGWDKLGYELFSYLIDKPTRYYDSLTTVTNTIPYLKYTDLDEKFVKSLPKYLLPLGNGRFSLKAKDEPGLALQQPRPERFSGQVYVLMNGMSASTTAEFTAAAHANQLATFVGQETGGAYQGGHSGEFAVLTLPHTKLRVSIPLVRYKMAVGTSGPLQRGTLPDYTVQPTIEEAIDGIDTVMNFALELIRNGPTTGKESQK